MFGPLKVTDDKILPDTMKTNPTPHDSKKIDAILGVGDGKKDLCVTIGTNGSAQEGKTVWKEKAKLIILQHLYSRPKGPLLDFLILDVAGTKEFDKMRLGLAMVDSLQ